MDTNLLIRRIAALGREHSEISRPSVKDIDLFHPLFTEDGRIDSSKYSDINDKYSYRELLTRYLLLNSVLDQGPDVEGVRLLLQRVINNLYSHGIRILHEPIEFFKNIKIVIVEIEKAHQQVKDIRSESWAYDNDSKASKYNLYMDNTTQTLNYAMFRWGVPLSVPLSLKPSNEPLLDYLEDDFDPEFLSSAEEMSRKIKKHKHHGMGKAIGNKAAHLFAKWIVHSYKLTRITNLAWGDYSFELPFDSNVGRVLFRTGYFLNWATIEDYNKFQFINKGAGKHGLNYIRVTNVRKKKSTINNDLIDKIIYGDLCINHLRSHKREPKKFEIQRIPGYQLLVEGEYSVGELDDGLMYIGTKYCFNLGKPNCESCPINDLCEGYQSESWLIENYRT